MNLSGRHFFIRIVVVMTCFGCISGCRNIKSSVKPESQADNQKIDSTSLFNGRSLEGWEVTNFGPQGPVYVSGDQIILGMGEGCTGITWKKSFPESGYEVTLDAKRISGNDFFCGITFPVGRSFCSLIIGGWAGTTVGLSSIDGRDASQNETKSLRSFDKDKWYHIRIAVTKKYIKAWIDNDKVVDFTIGNKKLSIRPEVELSKPFGIASWYTTAAIRRIHLTRINNN
jgi:hypothetical protein